MEINSKKSLWLDVTKVPEDHTSNINIYYVCLKFLSFETRRIGRTLNNTINPDFKSYQAHATCLYFGAETNFYSDFKHRSRNSTLYYKLWKVMCFTCLDRVHHSHRPITIDKSYQQDVIMRFSPLKLIP